MTSDRFQLACAVIAESEHAAKGVAALTIVADLAVRLDEIERESLRQAINHLLDEGEGKEAA